MLKILCCSLAMISNLSVANDSSDKAVIELVGEVFPPATNSDGTGQQFEMVQAIFESLGYKINVKVYPYKRALKLVETARADMMVGMLKDGDEKLLYSKYPHDADRLLAINHKENTKRWQGLTSLDNKRVLTLSGLANPIREYLPGLNFVLREVNTRKQAMQKLLYKRTDYIIDCECGYLLEEVNDFKNSVDTHEIGFLKIYLAFAKTERGILLKEEWDKSYLQYIRSDKAKEIYQRWNMLREYHIIQSVMNDVQL